MQRHQKTNKNSMVTKNPNPRHASQTNTNTTEHELKYPEASRSSFLKLVFGKLNLKEAMHAYKSNIFTSMVNLRNSKK